MTLASSCNPLSVLYSASHTLPLYVTGEQQKLAPLPHYWRLAKST